MTQQLTLAEQLALQIRSTGPMSVATYMGLCLTHPTRGYYRGADPLGAGGDFITAPEISQMFGEIIGFHLVNLWQQLGEPKAFTLLELGPGRGTLMADMLRVACRAPGFGDALQLRLFETSPGLMAAQQQRLAAYAPQWQQNFEDFPDGPLLVVANEFFDALPIRQFVRRPDGWHERLVGLVDDKFAFGLSPTPLPPETMPEAVAAAAPDSLYEAGIAGTELMTRLARTVAGHGGSMLVIDYGYAATQTGETLQGVRRHAYADVLDAPGETDLSAHVDFGALGEAARRAGLVTPALVTQGHFLSSLGIGERAATLARANPDAAAEVEAAHRRLVDEAQMGRLFKVFCAHSPGLDPAGFA